MSFLKNIALLIASPIDGWNEIKRFSVPSQVMLSRVLFPLLALLSLSAFAELLYHNDIGLAHCLQYALIEFAKFFFGYYICSYLLTGFFPTVAKDKDSANKVNVFIQYNLIVLILLDFVNNLLPTPFIYLYIFYLYVVFISIKGSKYLDVKEGDYTFVVIAAILFIMIPLVIQWFLSLFLITQN